MKIVMKAVAAIMLMTAVACIAGCTKPDEPNGGNDNGGGGNNNGIGTYNGHEYVDLGLPSGTLWATCNLGADKPERFGDYFAWGETNPKTSYGWDNYKYSNGNSQKLTKYCTVSGYGYNGFTDNLTVLLPEDDAATSYWGAGWRMPTTEECQELNHNTTHIWTIQNDVYGTLFTAKNGNTLFLPAAGWFNGNSTGYVGELGYYWTSLLDTGTPINASRFHFQSGGCGVASDRREVGYSVRAVCSDNGGNNGGLDNGTLKGTTWQLDNPHDEGFANYGDYRVIYTVAFGQDNDVTFTRQISCEEINYYQKPVMTGTYAYSNGSGVAMIHNEGETTDYRITFIVLGDDMLQWNYNLREIILFKQCPNHVTTENLQSHPRKL